MENELNINVAGSWSLPEEVNLLDAMVVCGQDWEAISKRCSGRSPDECERHYYNFFIDNPRLVDLGNLLEKTREDFHNSKKFLCTALLSDSFCACGETECDSLLNPRTIKQESSLSNVVEYKRECDSLETNVKNGLLKKNPTSLNRNNWRGNNSCLSETGGFSNLRYDPADFNRSDRKLDESKTFLARSEILNINTEKIKKEVEYDFDFTFRPYESVEDYGSKSSSATDRFNNLESDCLSSDENDKTLEADKVSSPETTLTEIKVFEDTKMCDVSCPVESSGNYSEFHGTPAGFDSNRVEFDIEFDNDAEETLKMLRHDILVETPDDDVDRNLLTELSLSIVEGYMHRLKERHRRKSLVQRFGLLDYSKIANYMKTVETTFGKRFAKRLVLFKRLFSSKEYDDFMKGYKRLNQLKNTFSTLCNYRERGITTLAAGNLYEKMSQMRSESNKQIQSIPVMKRLENGESVLGSSLRRPAPPIAVHEMPGYESLDKEEIDFCSLQRIAPKSFLEYKSTLINECKKRKCLKLAHARPLLKIDVNKTRKLFDLLMNKNLIWKDEKMTDQ